MSTSLIDPDAVEIGKLYRGSNQDIRAGLVKRLECGRRLILKKIEVGHGNFGAWVKANHKKLHFSSRSTTSRLIDGATEYCETFGHNPEEPIVALARQVNPKDVRGLLNAMSGHAGQWQQSGEYEWYTPAWLIEAARETMGGIDLDPASCEQAQQDVKAGEYYTMERNGLEQPWFGRVFVNPPYRKKIVTSFAERLMKAYQDREIEQAIWLCNVEPDVGWWKLIAQHALICLTYKRVKFTNPEGKTKELSVSQTVFYLGDRNVPFIRAFGKYGKIVGEWSEEFNFPEYDEHPEWYA